MTPLLIGLAIGLIASIAGYRIRRNTALRQLEDEIPAWVNQAPPTVIRLQDLVDAINFELWEDELESRT